jgi:hypothetical protein
MKLHPRTGDPAAAQLPARRRTVNGGHELFLISQAQRPASG